MWQVIQYYGYGYKRDFYFNKKENAENFFRKVIKKETLVWEEEGISPNFLGYNNWDEYTEASLNVGKVEDVAIIQKIITED